MFSLLEKDAQCTCKNKLVFEYCEGKKIFIGINL